MTEGWRDREGFGRPVEVVPAVYSTKGPDDLDHAAECEFISSEGILRCNCDATRGMYSQWGMYWRRWQRARINRHHTLQPQDRVPWPVMGPDGTAWIAGIDYDDTEGYN